MDIPCVVQMNIFLSRKAFINIRILAFKFYKSRRVLKREQSRPLILSPSTIYLQIFLFICAPEYIKKLYAPVFGKINLPFLHNPAEWWLFAENKHVYHFINNILDQYLSLVFVPWKLHNLIPLYINVQGRSAAKFGYVPIKLQ